MRDHLDDLASDFSAIHGIGDITTLSGPVFFRLAWRISSYQGVMRDHAMAHVAENPPEHRQEVPLYSAPGRTMHGGSRAELQAVPEFNGIFSYAEVG